MYCYVGRNELIIEASIKTNNSLHKTKEGDSWVKYIINDEKYHFKFAFDTQTGAYALRAKEGIE